MAEEERSSPVEVSVQGTTGVGESGAVLSNPPAADTRPRCSSARRGLAFYRIRASHWKILRGVEAKVRIAQPRGCAHTLWLANVWKKRAWAARQGYYRWVKRQYTLTAHNTWLEAVREAQKAYPGTEAWLKSCSATEGAWGPWVPNRDGAPPGGWMQMYESTFWRMWKTGWYDSGKTYPGAYTYLRSKGFQVPRSAHSWYSPIGQALASAHGYTFGRRGEWHSSGCYIN